MNEIAATRSRPLGRAERSNWLGELDACTNFALIDEIAGNLEESSLRKALDGAMRRHPMLRVRIKVGDELKKYLKSQVAPDYMPDEVVSKAKQVHRHKIVTLEYP